MTQMCYLARPLDLDGDTGYAEWVADRVTDAMGAIGLVAYSPAEAFLIPSGAHPNGEIAQINQLALSRCRGMIVLFPERPSVGTGLELQMAQDRGLPVLVVTTMATIEKSWSLAGLRGAHLLAVPESATKWTTADSHQIQRALTWLADQAQAVDRFGFKPGPFKQLSVVLDNDNCQMMTRSYRGDAGYDMYTSTETEIPPGEFVDVPCGISVQMPEGYWGMVVGRSSTLRKHRLLVMSGVIDNGYRGPMFAGVQNLGTEPFRAKVGSRLAQLVPMPLVADDLVQVRADQLIPSDRNDAGFGSSGD